MHSSTDSFSRLFRIAVLAALLPATAAVAADQAGAAVEADRPVCRKLESTGSRIAGKECHTRTEWMEIEAARRKQAEQFQRDMNNPAADRGISNSPIPR